MSVINVDFVDWRTKPTPEACNPPKKHHSTPSSGSRRILYEKGDTEALHVLSSSSTDAHLDFGVQVLRSTAVGAGGCTACCVAGCAAGCAAGFAAVDGGAVVIDTTTAGAAIGAAAAGLGVGSVVVAIGAATD